MWNGSQGFRIGACEVHPEDGTVRSPAGVRRLGPRPMAVLLALVAEPGRVFSREELMARVWSGLVVSDETLSRCISDLRQALDDDPRTPRCIETLARRGYRFIGHVDPLAGTPAAGTSPDPESAPSPPATAAADNAAANVSIAEVRSRRLRSAAPWLAAALTLALAAATWLSSNGGGGKPRTPPDPRLAANGIAVLPFANLSDDPELEYFSDGLSEELIHRLATVDALAVVARTSSFAFKGTNKDIREIGRDLGVAYVLEGSVRRQDDRVRIGAQLVDVQTGFRLFSRVYERPFSDLFAIQENVALEVGAALEPRLSGLVEGLRRAPAQTTPEALAAYLLGKHLQRNGTAENLELSAREFRRAIDLDPGFARAYAGLAETLALTSQYAELPIAAVRNEVEGLAAKALELDQNCAAAWHARGLLAFYENRLTDALEAFRIEVSLDPNLTGAITMQAWTLRSLGRNREALALTTRALRNDPINAHTITMHATLLAHLGDYDEAGRLMRRALEIDPNYQNAFWGMANLNWLQGRHTESARWYRSGIEEGIRQSHAYTELGRVLLELGDYQRSLEWLEAGIARATDPVSQLDGLLAWHQYQADYAGIAKLIQAYSLDFPQRTDLAPYRAFSALLNGNAVAAVREYESIAARNPERLNSHWDMISGYWPALFLARARQLAGARQAADAAIGQAEQHLTTFARETGFPGIVAYYRAAIASLRNDADRALEYLEAARQSGWRRPAQVRTSPLFAAVRGDARIRALLAEMMSGLDADRRAFAPQRAPGTTGPSR
ncbi:MAG TPA: winged helix-turn-helix domain-containing protein [Woeseiaceae bacterium]